MLPYAAIAAAALDCSGGILNHRCLFHLVVAWIVEVFAAPLRFANLFSFDRWYFSIGCRVQSTAHVSHGLQPHRRLARRSLLKLSVSVFPNFDRLV